MARSKERKPFPHATNRGYIYGCRCYKCKRAYKAYMHAYRKARRAATTFVRPAEVEVPSIYAVDDLPLPVSGSELRVLYINDFRRCEICTLRIASPRDVICAPCRRTSHVPRIADIEKSLQSTSRADRVSEGTGR